MADSPCSLCTSIRCNHPIYHTQGNLTFLYSVSNMILACTIPSRLHLIKGLIGFRYSDFIDQLLACLCLSCIVIGYGQLKCTLCINRNCIEGKLYMAKLTLRERNKLLFPVIAHSKLKVCFTKRSAYKYIAVFILNPYIFSCKLSYLLVILRTYSKWCRQAYNHNKTK